MLYKYFVYGIRQNFFKRVCEGAVRLCISSYEKKENHWNTKGILFRSLFFFLKLFHHLLSYVYNTCSIFGAKRRFTLQGTYLLDL